MNCSENNRKRPHSGARTGIQERMSNLRRNASAAGASGNRAHGGHPTNSTVSSINNIRDINPWSRCQESSPSEPKNKNNNYNNNYYYYNNNNNHRDWPSKPDERSRELKESPVKFKPTRPTGNFQENGDNSNRNALQAEEALLNPMPESRIPSQSVKDRMRRMRDNRPAKSPTRSHTNKPSNVGNRQRTQNVSHSSHCENRRLRSQTNARTSTLESDLPSQLSVPASDFRNGLNVPLLSKSTNTASNVPAVKLNTSITTSTASTMNRSQPLMGQDEGRSRSRENGRGYYTGGTNAFSGAVRGHNKGEQRRHPYQNQRNNAPHNRSQNETRRDQRRNAEPAFARPQRESDRDLRTSNLGQYCSRTTISNFPQMVPSSLYASTHAYTTPVSNRALKYMASSTSCSVSQTHAANLGKYGGYSPVIQGTSRAAPEMPGNKNEARMRYSTPYAKTEGMASASKSKASTFVDIPSKDSPKASKYGGGIKARLASRTHFSNSGSGQGPAFSSRFMPSTHKPSATPIRYSASKSESSSASLAENAKPTFCSNFGGYTQTSDRQSSNLPTFLNYHLSESSGTVGVQCGGSISEAMEVDEPNEEQKIQPMDWESIIIKGIEDRVSSDTRQWVVAIDSCVYITNLSFVEFLLSLEIPDLGSPIVFVPHLVLVELDGIKDDRAGRKNNETKAAARKAVSFLHKCFTTSHPRLRGENLQKFKEHDLRGTNSDDRFLMACLLLKQNYPNLRVMLVTNDTNFRTKAFIENLEQYSLFEFREFISDAMKNSGRRGSSGNMWKNFFG